jgi:hypothetical protein
MDDLTVKLKKIEQLITNEIKNDDDLYTEKGRAERVNRIIYNKLFEPYITDINKPENKEHGDNEYVMSRLNAHIKSLDKTRIKSPIEYFNEVNNSPINLLMGSRGYMPPEYYVGADTKTQFINEDNDERPLAINKVLQCNLENENLNLSDLISKVYLKYMYSQDQLHNCRHLIKQKINLGETMNASSATHLKQIDTELYRLYISKRELYNPMTKMALGIKKRKSRKDRKSRKINRRKSKYVKKY